MSATVHRARALLALIRRDLADGGSRRSAERSLRNVASLLAAAGMRDLAEDVFATAEDVTASAVAELHERLRGWRVEA